MTRQFCATVLQRWDVIQCLGRERRDKRSLAEELDCSRSTVNRAVRELVSLGVVERVGGGYALTPLGCSVASRFGELMDTVDLLREYEPFLRWLPREEWGFELGWLADAELVLPTAGNPYSVIDRHVRRLREMEEGHFLLPFTGMHAAEAACDRVVHHGAECEFVVTPAVADVFQMSPEFRPAFEEMAATDRLDLFRATGDLPLGIGLIDGRVQMIAAEGEEPRALVETDRPEVYEWARSRFEADKQRSEPVSLP